MHSCTAEALGFGVFACQATVSILATDVLRHMQLRRPCNRCCEMHLEIDAMRVK